MIVCRNATILHARVLPIAIDVLLASMIFCRQISSDPRTQLRENLRFRAWHVVARGSLAGSIALGCLL